MNKNSPCTKAFTIAVFVICSLLFVIPPSVAGAATLGGAGITQPINNLGLVGYWPFEETSGTITADRSGMGNTGTLVSTPARVAGKIGRGLNNNSTGYVTVPSSSYLFTSPFSLSIWVKPTDFSATQYLFAQGYSFLAGGYVFRLDSSTGVPSIFFNTASLESNATGPALTTGAWSLVTAVYDGTAMTVYTNGVAGTPTTAAYTPLSGVMGIGATNLGSGPIIGLTDEARYYNRVLSAAEVKALYNNQSAKLGVVKRLYLTTGSGSGNQTFNVPANWNSAKNSIECIGSGGTGSTQASLPGGGGGGGAYARITNLTLTPGGTATYAIGASATTSTDSAAVGMARETYFNGTASSSASLSCSYGKTVITQTGGVGGSAGLSTGSTKFAGGAGGTAVAGDGEYGGGGGGGSAGPSGAGKAGGAATSGFRSGGGGGGSNGGSSTAGAANSGDTGTAGGHGTDGTGAGTGAAGSCTAGTAGGGGGAMGSTGAGPGCSGSLDTSFDSTHGAGGGGGGGNSQTTPDIARDGGAGATYGGGGGGGAANVTAGAHGAGGAGGIGLIVITYTPLVKIGQSSAAGQTKGLVGHWTMDGSKINWTTNVMQDSSGQGNNGQLISLATSSAPTPGKVGQALQFNGSSSYVSVGDIAQMNSASSLTVSAWLKRRTSSGCAVLAKFIDDNNRTNMSLWSDGNIYFTVSNGGLSYGSLSNSDTNWHHLVLVFDGSQSGNAKLKGYLDSVSQPLSYSGTFPTVTASGGMLEIGRFNSTYCAGTIDDVRVYNRALSANEIKQLYMATK